ncbi:ABC transporter ATP-binding protein [Methylobacterium frigidaeris]|uniref:Glutathione import ATP-binding protein GsiA n=1 Tax=Methylobacterium frigidaeris TaxID=2038277 RepID=A0AA37M4R3_9HYPH|nr:ABC transporter ATP-binding protein [Methylobacterium frigidaeris]PIK71606.1 microcin ABC transporter ATP-binding protein [Methylobacterium frigidaeris]GJD62410.1 Glutathione import ATP-binding protein GsiA [Methylobacterium frigidaeris]
MSELLTVRSLSVRLPPGADRSHALTDVSLSLAGNEILCVVGESGSGKSVLANTVMRLLPAGVRPDAGQVLFRGRDLVGASEAEMRRLRGAAIGMIFQEPMTALNPLRRAGDQIAETFRIHTTLSARAIREKTLALLTEVRMPDPAAALRAYPHELSGGQRQRVMIAMALALEPALLIADEPTTALDVTTQGRILALIRDIQRRRGMGVLFITHDFGVVAEIADRVAVMQAGRLVEEGPADAVLNRPQAPYTKALIGAVPPLLPRPPRPASGPAILSLSGVSKTYRKGGGLLPGRARVTHAVRDVSLSLPRGTTLGIVGESGSGKSTLARCIVRLLDPDTGTIRLGDTDLAGLSRRAMRAEARRVQMVFQDPFASLNPRRRAGELVAQGPMLHGVSRSDALAKARELFGLVGLDPVAMDRFPHEFSGGQRQRIGLARALALEPEVLVADEPVSALDVSVQAQVLALLDSLRDRLGLSMLFITHDLRVAGQICDRIAVMKDGAVVEAGPTAEVFAAPQAAYTRALLEAVPGRSWIPGRPHAPAA